MNDLIDSKRLSGSESIARALKEAGTKLVASYPGGPITGIVEILIDEGREDGIYVEWSSCEKVAFELALGCSLGGRRSAIAAKHVGINHILDPLMTANLTGTFGGLVILAGDDPGAYGSQNEQDSRLLGAFAEIPILEPATPGQGYSMTRQAFRLSEAFRLPVMVRFTAGYTIDKATVSTKSQTTEGSAGFNHNIRWKALPAKVVKDHAALHDKIERIREVFNHPPYRSFNNCEGDGHIGIIAAGYMAARLRCCAVPAYIRIFELGTVFPLPEKQIIAFIERVKKAYILEEVEPFVEGNIRSLAQRQGLQVEIIGKTDGSVPWEGDFHLEKLFRFLEDQLQISVPAIAKPVRTYPSRRPFGNGCPYTPFFTTLQDMVLDEKIPKPIVVGETGCLVRLNNSPFEMLDVKYSMGSSISIACGLVRSGISEKILAVTGDSAFLHSGINGLINAAHHQHDITVVVMDNETIAMTGFQAPASAAITAMGKRVEPIYIERLAEAIGIDHIHIADAFDEISVARTITEAFDESELSCIVVRGRCPYIETKRCHVSNGP
jgi:indolepyruvate ferredoxin oxidoreductase alpha subunit